MSKHVSCYGVVPLRKVDAGYEVLLVNHKKGFWGFPKGHKNPGETDFQAAERELFEETGLQIVKTLDKTPFQEHYHYTEDERLYSKTVFYFVAVVEGTLSLQKEEILESRWVSLKESIHLATFPESKKICQETICLLI